MTDVLYDKPIVVYPDQAMRDAVSALARQEDRKLGRMARQLIREALERRGVNLEAQPTPESAATAKS